MTPSELQCHKKFVDTTVGLLSKLGFVIHSDKSLLKSTQKIEFLGFVIDSVDMPISIQSEKSNRIVLKIKSSLTNTTHSIRYLASIIGLVISIFSSSIIWKYVKLQYRTLGKEKILKKNAGNFEAKENEE